MFFRHSVLLFLICMTALPCIWLKCMFLPLCCLISCIMYLSSFQNKSLSKQYIAYLSPTPEIHLPPLLCGQAESNLKQYGKVLMHNVPQPTTELLKRLCTDYKPTDSEFCFLLLFKDTISKITSFGQTSFIFFTCKEIQW